MKPKGNASAVVTAALIVAATWTAWEIVKAPLAARLPVQFAVRLAPTSPEVLRRAAEQELAEKRPENAAALAEESLARAPFNVRALRVLGLASAETEGAIDVDSVMTLAGNWSLRDDPSHAWLIERRLRQGNYGSAFAHADTLARRRVDNPELTFNFFATAALHDDRALAPLAGLLAKNPPWRGAFVGYLLNRRDMAVVLVKLGIVLDRLDQSFNVMELRQIYETWFSAGQFAEMVLFRQQTDAPPVADRLMNGNFSQVRDERILPLDWMFGTGSNFTADVIVDDFRPGNLALRADVGGREEALLAEQVLMLPTGAHTLFGEYRIERGEASRLRWALTCVESGESLGGFRPSDSDSDDWRRFSAPFSVPAANCTLQRLRLESPLVDQGDGATQWFDALRIQPS